MHATDTWLPGNAESEVRPRPSAEPPGTAAGPSRPVQGPSAPFHPTSGCWRRELHSGVVWSPQGVGEPQRRALVPWGAGKPRPPSSYVSGVATCPAPRPWEVVAPDTLHLRGVGGPYCVLTPQQSVSGWFRVYGLTAVRVQEWPWGSDQRQSGPRRGLWWRRHCLLSFNSQSGLSLLQVCIVSPGSARQ